MKALYEYILLVLFVLLQLNGVYSLYFVFRILTEKAQIGQNDIYFGPFSVVSDLVRVRKTMQTTGDYRRDVAINKKGNSSMYLIIHEKFVNISYASSVKQFSL